MKKLISLAVACGLVVVVGVGLFLGWTDRAWANRQVSAGSKQDLTDLQSRIARLEEEPRQQLIVNAANTEPTPSSAKKAAEATPSNDTAAAALEPDEVGFRQEQVVQLHAQTISSALERESVDKSWASEASGAIMKKYQGEDFADVAVSAVCKSTLCRVEFSGASVEKAERAMRRMANDPPWAAAGMYHVDTSTGEGYAFLSRENHELPTPPADAVPN